ncbi:hypothetical protein MSG28_013777 [Choristoneura fumiferana]|uniref:Uncharacterized protein n=1 Tax=Choristoneura fumiferana TaxID=7141 RepID=A0ACC0K8W5_CHOFU|nr:hypothetical protein MSG28_013777 [Choristoneura fumiferana]
MGDADGDDDDIRASPYDNGYWVWSDTNCMLEFKSNNLSQSISNVTIPPAMIAGVLQFNDDPDLIEQFRFQKRFQRKTKDNDVVKLQDVKDVALFTAPSALFTKDIILLFHKPAMDRFLRALIFYCQYFLQISDELNHRALDAKIKTANSKRIVEEFRENLQDARLIVAKEYSSMSMGGEDFQSYHHMGANKMSSLSAKDAVRFEKMLRFCVQVVWIVLGRVSLVEIEVEINRLFKSDKYNFAKHKYNHRASLSHEDRSLILGECLDDMGMLRSLSPLMNEVFCHSEGRLIDARLLGLAVLKQNNLQPRLKYFEYMLVLPEEKLQSANITLGILGAQRSSFDSMLKLIKESHGSRSTSASSMVMTKRASRVSTASIVSSRFTVGKLYADIVLPEKEFETDFTDEFPTEMYPRKQIDKVQKKKWLNRVIRKSATNVANRKN